MQRKSPILSLILHLINTDPLGLQIRSRNLNLAHQFLVSLRHIVEGKDTVSEFEKEVCAEGDEGPEGELRGRNR
jgi:hypothetical protein